MIIVGGPSHRAGRVFSIGRAGAEADWASRSSGAAIAENFSDYADRGEWMTFLQTAAHTSGVHYAYTGVPFNGGVDGNYANPVPSGTEEKLGLDADTFLTGGKSSYHRLYQSEGGTEAGPVFEMGLPAPLSEFYLQFAIRIDAAIIGHSFGGSRTKIAMPSHLDFEGGEVVVNLHNKGGQRLLSGYRVRASADGFQNTLSAPPLPTGETPGLDGDFGLYPLLDTNPSRGTNYASIAEWEQRHGFRYRNFDTTDPDFADIPAFTGDEWYVVTAYINYDFVGSVSNGMVKFWLSKYGEPPQLVVGALQDCGLILNFASESIRMIFRPENAVNAVPATFAGVHFDEIIVKEAALQHPGGHDLPFPGTEIPTGYPYSGQVED